MTDLRDRLRAEVQRRREIAEKARDATARNVINGAGPEWITVLHADQEPAIECEGQGAVIVPELSDGTRQDRQAYAAHIAANDPATVLRRLAADDKIIDLHHGPYTQADGAERTTRCRGCAYTAPCPTLLALADGHGIKP